MSLKKWVLIGGLFLIFLVIVFFLLKPTPPTPIKLPNPNGYDDLVKAGQMFASDLPESYWVQSETNWLEETKAYLDKNGEALRMARLGLGRKSRVPISNNQVYMAQHINDLALFKKLAQTLAAEGRVAETENRVDDALRSYLDAARLNEKLRGGVMIDALVGIACEAIGINALQKVAHYDTNNLTRDQRQVMIKSFEELYLDRDSLKEVLANERIYVRSAYGIRDRIAGWYLSFFAISKTPKAKFENKIRYRRARLGLFMTDLAVGNFTLDKGRPPTALQELIPDYLSFLPRDDFSGKDFIYRSLTNGYVLYGVGSDRKDDGGKPFVKRGMDSPGDMLPNAQY